MRAAPSESTSMSSASTTADSGRGQTSGDGRPGVPSSSPRPSVTNPSATSSRISPRIAPRVRPVRATSSERDRGPSTWTFRTIALRLARRTVSLRSPRSSRPEVTGLCSSCPNGRADCTPAQQRQVNILDRRAGPRVGDNPACHWRSCAVASRHSSSSIHGPQDCRADLPSLVERPHRRPVPAGSTRRTMRPSRSKAIILIAALAGVAVVAAGVVVIRPWSAERHCPTAATHADWSVARRWDEALLDAIRRALPNPPVHARNLFHTSVAMWDAWATYDQDATGELFTEKHTAGDLAAARDEAISYAAYGVLSARYIKAVGGDE